MKRTGTVLAVLMVTASCTVSPPMVVLTRVGCKNSNMLRARLGEALQGLGRLPSYTLIDADTLPSDDAWRGYGTPTILIGNRDLFGMSAQTPTNPPT